MSESEDSPRQHNPMRRILGNLGFLVRGKGLAAVMLLGSTALMARALGPAEFGLIVLIQTYTLLVRGLFNFQLFEAVVRYGVASHDAGDTHSLRRLIAICWRIDRYTCIIATVLAMALAPVIGPLMGMDHEHVILLTLYSLVLLTTGNGTATGLLRLFDQFNTLGKQMTIGPSISFIGVVIAWYMECSLSVFVAILAIAFLTENLYLNWFGWREYHQRVGPPAEGESINDAKMAEFSDLRHFLKITYWQSNLDLMYKNLSIMLIGSMLGATEAGLLRLARQFSSLLAKPSVLLRQVIFLDLTRSWNEADPDFKLIVYRTALLGGAFGLLFVLVGYLWGEVLLELFVGKEFIGAASVLTLLLLSATFDISASSLRAAAYAMGLAGKVLTINAVATIVYIVLFIVLVPMMGLVGAGVAACIAAVMAPIAMTLIIHRSINNHLA